MPYRQPAGYGQKPSAPTPGPRARPPTPAETARIRSHPGPSRQQALQMAAYQALDRSGVTQQARRSGSRTPGGTYGKVGLNVASLLVPGGGEARAAELADRALTAVVRSPWTKRVAIGAGAAWLLGANPNGPRWSTEPVPPQFTDRQVANQKRSDQHKLAAFLWELDETASSGQMSRKEASQASRWAAGQAKGPEGYGWTPELASARNWLHSNFKPPRGGWEP